MFLSQKTYIERILKRFHLESVNGKVTPCMEGVTLKKNENKTPTNEFKRKYPAMVGSFQYLVKMSRADVGGVRLGTGCQVSCCARDR